MFWNGKSKKEGNKVDWDFTLVLKSFFFSESMRWFESLDKDTFSCEDFCA